MLRGRRRAGRVRNNRAIQRVAELPEGVVVMEDPADQVPVGVELLPHGVVVGAGVEDVEGTRAATADDPDVVRTVGLDVRAFTDRSVADRHAGLPGWRRGVER